MVTHRDPPEKKLITTGYYGMVRHPIMSCMMAVLFVSPNMVTHFTLYIYSSSINVLYVIYLHRGLVNYYLPSP